MDFAATCQQENVIHAHEHAKEGPDPIHACPVVSKGELSVVSASSSACLISYARLEENFLLESVFCFSRLTLTI